MAETAARLPEERDPLQPGFYRTWLAREGEAPPPRHVSLDLTYRCNLRCNMCFLYGQHLQPENPTLRLVRERRELSVEAWRQVLSELRDYGVRALVVTGGEVFLKKGLLRLLRFAHVQGFQVSMLTNGALVSEERADALVRYGPSFLRFSLDGDRETHDAICGRPSYDRLLQAIDRIRAAQARHGLRRPALGFETVIQRRNQDRLHHVLEVARAKGIRHVTVSNLFFAARNETSRSRQLTRHVLSPLCDVDPDVVAGELERCRKLAAAWGIELVCRMKSREEVEAIYHDPAFSFLGRCFYPWLMARIDPFGDVIPCTGSRLALGNVQQTSFAEIWNGPAYRRFRLDLLEAGLFPECAKCNTLSDEAWSLWDRVPVPSRRR